MSLLSVRPSHHPLPTSLPTGSVVAGRYFVDALLGHGGMGEVYRVVDQSSGETCALKRLREDLGERQPAIEALFEREYHTLKQLAHPRVIRVHDYGISEHGAFYTMELLDGDDAQELAPLPWREACVIVRDIASSLAMLHSRRMLHRDVSPRNIRCDEAGAAKLFDFGAMATMGVSGQVIGTPPCIPPEAVHGQALDARSDIYALGAAAYWTLTGRHAYPARTVAGLRDVWRSRPRAPSHYQAQVPSALDQLVLSMLSLDPLARPVGAAEVIERLTVIADLEQDESEVIADAYLAMPPLLGRSAEVLKIRKVLLRAGRGRGSVTLVEGEAGLGHSRLLQAAELEGKLAGATVVGVAPRAEAAWGVVRGIAEELFELVPDDAMATAAPLWEALADALPDLAARLAPTEATSGAEPTDAELDAAAAFACWLVALSKRNPLLVVVDCAQHVDLRSMSALALVAEQCDRRQIAMVLSLPDGVEVAAPAAVGALRRRAARIQLEPLAADDVLQLARSLFGDVANVTRVGSWLMELSGGSPRAAMELARHLVEQGIARYEHGSWVLPTSFAEHSLPGGFEGTLEHRVGQLSDGARRLLLSLACTDASLSLDEYPMLLDGAPENLFAAIDELVYAGILVTQQDRYALAQPAYREVAPRIANVEELRQQHRRLAVVFEQREDRTRQASHLLTAGEEEAAIEAIVLARQGRGDLRYGTRDYSTIEILGDATMAVRTHQLLLQAAARLGRPPLDIFTIRGGLTTEAFAYDPSLVGDEIDKQMRQIQHDLGADLWDEVEGDAETRAKRCAELAQARFDATPEDERVLSPQDALRAGLGSVGFAATLGRQAYDVELLERGTVLAERMMLMQPMLRALHLSVLNSLELVRGRDDVSRAVRAELHAYYEGLEDAGVDLPPISRLGRAIARTVDGIDRARRGGDAAAVWAEHLAGRMYDDPKVNRLGQHIWHRRAWEIRRLMHLFDGDAPAARECQAEIERLAVRHAFSHYGGGTAHLEAQAHAMCGDLMGLKQSIDTLDHITREQYPRWEPWLCVARGDYQRLRGNPREALPQYDRALEAAPPGRHGAHCSAATGRVEALVALGEPVQAVRFAQSALSTCREHELDELGQLHLERVLALAELAAGETQQAAQHLDTLLARAAELELAGAVLGTFHEARTRVAVVANDTEAFEHHAVATSELYGAGRSPALAAKLERLMEEAAASGLELDGVLARFARGHEDDDSEGGYHTELAQCEGTAELRQRGLTMLMERTGASGGHLFMLCEDGNLELAASEPQAPPPPALTETLTEYVRAELDDTADVTVTCFDQGPGAASNSQVTAYRPVLLSETTDGRRRIVGIAALACSEDQLESLVYSFVSTVSRALVEPREEVVMSIFG